MTSPHTPDHSPLAADDPRISEWLDGRLAPPDAAHVERAVQASPELVALVDDLRAIRGAMRALPTDHVPASLSDSVMAAIAASPAAAPALETAANPVIASSGRGRRMPWMALVGALAAGILATVVVNLPDEKGREVALGPAAERDKADAKKFAEREAPADSSRLQQDLAATTGRVGEEQAASAKDDLPASGLVGQAQPSVEGRLAGAGGAGGGFDGEPEGDEKKRLEAPAESLSKSRDSAELADESVAGGNRFRAKESEGESELRSLAAGAPATSSASVVAETAEPPFIPPVPATPVPAAAAAPAIQFAGGAEGGKLARADADAPALDALAGDALRTAANRRGAVPVGVVVIAVGRPSERRAVENLVAASGLEVTPVKDHLELVGTVTAVDSFLVELEEAGLVPPGTAPRKLKADRQGGRELRSLVLRVVDRKAKQGKAAAGEEKP